MKPVVLLALLFSLTSLLHSAPTDRYEELTGDQDDFEANVKEWKESFTQIPPLPDDGAWAQVQIDSLPANQRAFLDLGTMSISDKDYVVRYWLLVRSTAGGYTATFEGLRCGTGEYAVYAYGNPRRDPAVREVKKPKWKKTSHTRSGYRAELADDVFCSGGVPRERYQIEQAVQGRFEQLNPFDNWTNDD